jgi:NAD(P)-dependent dehydrogenase (short-subunit alcohol dehydrogenase family)
MEVLMTANTRVALITGSTDGVGRRVAERLADGGATVLIHGRDQARGERLLADIRKAGGTGDFLPADLLAEELKGSSVTANCLHPATYMDTAMVRDSGVSPLSSVEEGADAILHLARSGEMAGRTGLYFDGLRESRANAQAYDTAARERLRTLSLALTGLA